MAIGAQQPRVRRTLKRRVLGFHHRMAGKPTKLDRLHFLDAFVGCTGNDDNIDHRCAEQDQHPVAGLWLVKIEDRQQRHRFTAWRPANPAPVQQGSERNKEQSDDKDHRQNQKRDDAEIGPAFEANLRHGVQADDKHEGRNREACAEQAYAVSGNRRKEVLEHSYPYVVATGRAFFIPRRASNAKSIQFTGARPILDYV